MESIDTINKHFMHELGDIYDAEHQFLKGQEEMLQNASDATLKQMITTHMEQTRQHIANLDQVFSILGGQSERVMCDGAKGIVSEGQKGIREAAGSSTVRDVTIAGAAGRVEHYEIAVYRALITGAELMGQTSVVNLLRQNLQQEEQTAALIEQNLPALLQTAMRAEGLAGGTAAR